MSHSPNYVAGVHDVDSTSARLGIMTTGKAYLDVRQAFADLGISDAAARDLDLRIYKVGLS